MAKIAVLKGDYFFNFDNSRLYKGKIEIKEIKKREAEFLRCLCEKPKTNFSIAEISEWFDEWDYNNGYQRRGGDNEAGELYLSKGTIRRLKSDLLNEHEIFKTVVGGGTGKGYIYNGKPLKEQDIDEIVEDKNKESFKIHEIKEKLIEKAEKSLENDKNYYGALPYEVEMNFTAENGLIDGYESLRDSLFSSSENFAIGGEGGIGKSFLLKKLFYENINDNTPILIFVKLNDLNTCTRVAGKSLIELLLIMQYEKISFSDLFNIVQNGEDEAPKLILLLDGFNEISYKDRYDLFRDPLLRKIQIVLSTRSDEGIPEEFDFKKIRINEISDIAFADLLSKNGMQGDYSNVPRTPLFLKLLLMAAKLKQPFGKLLRNDGTVESILHNYVLCEMDKAISSIKAYAGISWVDVSVVAYFVIPYLAYRMVSDNIFSASYEKIGEMVAELIVPETGELYVTKEDKCSYNLSPKFLSAFRSKSKVLKQLNIFDDGERVGTNENLIELTYSLINDKNIFFIKNDIEGTVTFSFLHQTVQEYLAQLFIYDVVSTEIIVGDILFDEVINISYLSYIYKLFTKEQVQILYQKIKDYEKWLDYRIGLLRTIWDRELMGDYFSYSGLDLSKTRENLIKHDLLEGINVFGDAKLGLNNVDFNPIFGRDDNSATAIIHAWGTENGIKTISDDGIIRTWVISNNKIKCVRSERTKFYFSNKGILLKLYPPGSIEETRMTENVTSYIADMKLEEFSKATIIRGYDQNLLINKYGTIEFDGHFAIEIGEFHTKSEIVRGCIKNTKVCIQEKNGEIILWDDNLLHKTGEALFPDRKRLTEIVKFTPSSGKLISFAELKKDEYVFIVQEGLNLNMYIYGNDQLVIKEIPNVLRKKDVITYENVIEYLIPTTICLGCENGSIIGVFIDDEKNIDIRRFDDVHDCRITSIFLNSFNDPIYSNLATYQNIDDRAKDKEKQFIYLCSCDESGTINVSSPLENKEGLWGINAQKIFNFDNSLKKQIIPFWNYYEGYDEINNVNDIVFKNKLNSLSHNLSAQMVPVNINKWHIFDGCLYNYTGDCDFECIPENVRIIGKSAFANSQVKHIKIPNSVEVIEEYAFENSEVTTINFPDNLVDIGDYAFYSCKNLEKANFAGKSIFLGDHSFARSGIQSVYFEGDRISVGKNCFESCGQLETLTIKNCSGELGNASFAYCHNLKSIDLGTCIEKIGRCAFQFCGSIESVEIPSSLKELGGSAFYGCRRLKKSIVLGKFKEFSLSAFSDCDSLEYIVIPNKVRVLYEDGGNQIDFEEGIAFSNRTIFLPKTMKVMNKSFYDSERKELELLEDICNKDDFKAFKREVLKKMPISDESFLKAYNHNPEWAEYMLENGFNTTCLARIFYESICMADTELLKTLLKGIKDTYFIDKYECFSLARAIELMLHNYDDKDAVGIIDLLLAKEDFISRISVEVILSAGSRNVLDYFIQYLFDIHYFDDIQDFSSKIRHIIDIFEKGNNQYLNLGSDDLSFELFACRELGYMGDYEKEIQDFLVENPELDGYIGIRNCLNKFVLVAIEENYLKYYKKR